MNDLYGLMHDPLTCVVDLDLDVDLGFDCGRNKSLMRVEDPPMPSVVSLLLVL